MPEDYDFVLSISPWRETLISLETTDFTMLVDFKLIFSFGETKQKHFLIHRIPSLTLKQPQIVIQAWLILVSSAVESPVSFTNKYTFR